MARPLQRELRRQGRDIVVGIAETRGRGETAAQTERLEILPRRRVSYQGRWLDVIELLGSAVTRLQHYQPEVCVQTTVAADVPAIWVHPALIEQAVFNVLENAGKFSPPGEPVQVEAKLVDGALRIDVRDRGPGIPEDERSRIFDMFYSVERGDRGRHGTGLGLAICQGMVGAHGGSVQALPGPDGRGTVIRITLPLLTPAPQASA